MPSPKAAPTDQPAISKYFSGAAADDRRGTFEEARTAAPADVAVEVRRDLSAGVKRARDAVEPASQASTSSEGRSTRKRAEPVAPRNAEADKWQYDAKKCRVRVHWTGCEPPEWFAGVIKDFNPGNNKHLIAYDDGEQKWHRLAEEELEWPEGKPGSKKQEKAKAKAKEVKKTPEGAPPKPKRPRQAPEPEPEEDDDDDEEEDDDDAEETRLEASNNQTPAQLAELHGIDLGALLRANAQRHKGIKANSKLREGTDLVLPSTGKSPKKAPKAAAKAPKAAAAKAAPKAAAKAPKPAKAAAKRAPKGKAAASSSSAGLDFTDERSPARGPPSATASPAKRPKADSESEEEVPLSERRAAKAVKAAKAAAEADAAVERPPPPGTALADALPLLRAPATAADAAADDDAVGRTAALLLCPSRLQNGAALSAQQRAFLQGAMPRGGRRRRRAGRRRAESMGAARSSSARRRPSARTAACCGPSSSSPSSPRSARSGRARARPPTPPTPRRRSPPSEPRPTHVGDDASCGRRRRCRRAA